MNNAKLLQFIQNKALFTIFLCTNAIFLIASSFETMVRDESFGVGVTFAIILHTIGIASFCIGYGLCFLFGFNNLKNYSMPRVNCKKIYNVKKNTIRTSYILCIFGVFVSFTQIGRFISIDQYISDLITFSNPGDVRENFLATKEEGGLAGIFKMWAYAPLGVFLATFSITTFLTLTANSRASLRNLSYFSLVSVVIKVGISLDRLSILAIVIAFLLHSIYNKKLFRTKNIIIVCVISAFTSFISGNRLTDAGIFDFLILYCRLGLVNVEILVDSLNNYSYGFFTILSPIRPIFKFFVGEEFGLASLNYESGWHAAQYLIGYSFLDFGYFFFILYILLGFMAGRFDYECMIGKIPMAISIYFALTYCYASFIFVPAFTGIEFWLTLMIGLFMASGLVLKEEARKLTEIKSC